MPVIPKNSLPLWVSQLLIGIILPDEINVSTSISLGSYAPNIAKRYLNGLSGVYDYPGAIPDFSTNIETTPTTNGVNYNVQLKKSVGLYGFIAEVSGYDRRHFNDWSYPVERLNMGYTSLLHHYNVIESKPIHHPHQLIQSTDCVTRLTMAKLSHDSNDLVVLAENACANAIAYHLYKNATLSVTPLPVYEVWELAFTNTEEEEPSTGEGEGDWRSLSCEELYARVGGGGNVSPGDPWYDAWVACFES